MSRAITLGRHAAVSLLLAVVAAGCGRPPDEAWLRFVGFRAAGGTTGISVVNAQLLDETTNTVDAAFENATVIVGKNEGGTGILVDRARVEYRAGGVRLPDYEYPVTLYLAAPGEKSAPTSGTLSGLPIVPASLKEWILANGLPRHPEVQLTARVTFFALTDDGNRLEVTGGIPIVIANAGGTDGEKPTVSVGFENTADATAEEDPLDTGAFTVSRTGATTAALAVTYALSGTATSGTDYQTLDGSVVIPAGSATARLVVTPIPDSLVEVPAETVTLTLSPGSSYTVGIPASATVTIRD
jgi:hypothetical protein